MRKPRRESPRIKKKLIFYDQHGFEVGLLMVKNRDYVTTIYDWTELYNGAAKSRGDRRRVVAARYDGELFWVHGPNAATITH